MNHEPVQPPEGILLQDLFARVRTKPADRPPVSSMDATFQLMAILAAPRVLAGPFVSEELLGWMRDGLWRRILDQYLGTLYRLQRGLEDEPDALLHTERAARRARALLASWPWTRTAPEPVVQVARELFAAFGWTEQKWDEAEVPLSRGLDPAILAAVQAKKEEGARMNVARLTGAFFPCEGESWVVLVMAATQRAYLPCFSTEAKLREGMALDLPFDRVERIDHGEAFASRLGERTGDQALRMMLDPHFTRGPGMRWGELERDFDIDAHPMVVHILAFAGDVETTTGTL